MTERTRELLRELKRGDQELNEMYHEIAVRMGISDSVFAILYAVYDLGDGCLQKDICREMFLNKQTVNSAMHKLVKEDYLYMEQGRGRDKHIYFTEKGNAFIREKILPVIQKEEETFLEFCPEEQEEIIRLVKMYNRNFKKNFGLG